MMRKFLLFALLILSFNCFGAVSSSGRASVSEPTIGGLPLATWVSINTASQMAINANRQAAMVNNAKVITTTNAANAYNLGVASGILICDSDRESVDGTWSGPGSIVNGCKTMSIQDFFNKYKPKDATEVTMVIYDREHDQFQI